MDKKLKWTLVAGFITMLIITIWSLTNSSTNSDNIEVVNVSQAEEKFAELQDLEPQFKLAYYTVQDYRNSQSNGDVTSLEFIDGHIGEEEKIDIENTPHSRVEFLFFAIMENNPDLFVQMFEPTIISNALHSVDYDGINKLPVAEEFIDSISRNGKIESIGFMDKDFSLFSKNDPKVRILYNDGKEAEFTINFVGLSDAHDEGHNEDIIYAATSPLDIIKEIESTLTDKKYEN